MKNSLMQNISNMIKITFGVYMISILYFTLFWRTGGFTGAYNLNLNAIPFYWIWEPLMKQEAFSLAHVILNVFLFVPLGIFLPLIRKQLGFREIFLCSFITTLLIELLQPFFGRITDIDDIILNVTGAILGFICYKLLIACQNLLENDYYINQYYIAKIRQ